MKRYAVIAAVFAFLCGCSPEKPELTFMTGGAPHEFKFWKQVCEDFTRETGTAVTLVRSATQTEQRKQQILVGLRGRKSNPDVFAMDIAWIGQFAWSDWLEPLDQYGLDGSAFFENIISLADMHNGRLIGLPLFVDAGLLYYRTDLLQKYGYDAPPATWPELVEMAREIQRGERKTSPDFWGFVWQGAQYEGLVCNALEYFVSSGGAFFDNETGATLVNSGANRSALGFMRDLIHEYKVSPPNTFTDMREEEVRLVFQNGNAMFERNWPYAMKLHGDSGSVVRGKYDIAVLPHFDGSRSAATLGGWHVGVSKYSDMKKEAVEFVKYCTSYEVQKKMLLELSHNPGRPDVYDDPEIKGVGAGALREMFHTAVPRPIVPYYSEVSLILQKHISAVIAGRIEPASALEAAHGEIEKIVHAYGL